ncbi:MAG TPA: Hpt domain-containing protein, partial [Thermodesulfovibrionales bacterium]|nr:Hpt domain-containing protein [Thermodesulfovibrionales bacterium]
MTSLMGQNKIPILAMTAHEGETETAKCRNAGCAGHITKPVTRDGLLYTLSTFLQTSAPASEQTEDEPAERPVVHIDPDLAVLIPRFLDNRRKDAAEIIRLLAGNDLDAIRIIGHSMAGSCGGYGFPEMGTIGKAIENASLNADHTKIKELADTLSAYLSRVIVVMGKG